MIIDVIKAVKGVAMLVKNYLVLTTPNLTTENLQTNSILNEGKRIVEQYGIIHATAHYKNKYMIPT